MRIIIEGVDRIGKTTLAKKLAKMYKIDYMHFTGEDPTTYTFYSETMKKTNFVYDRHLVGEMVYPKVFKRKAMLDGEKFQKLLNQAKQDNVKIIVLTTEDSKLLEKRMKLEKHEQVKENFVKINNAFSAYAINFKSHIKLINVDEKNWMKQVMEYLNERNL